MMLTEEIEIQDKKSSIWGLVTSLGIHGVLLIIFIFLIAYSPPNPPLPSYGVELNFGLDNQGSGDVQTMEAAGENPNPSSQESPTEPTPEQTSATAAASDPTEASPIEDPNAETAIVAPVKAKEEKQGNEETPQKNTSDKNSQNPATTTPTVNSKALFSNSKSGNNNNGDDVGKVGDKGNPEGSLNAKALYGNPGTGNGGPGGSGGGSYLELSGWVWDFKPKPKDESTENGRIVFEIKVNQDGEIESIRTIEKTVTPAVEKIYKAEVEKLTFSKLNAQTEAPPVSVGRITFIIRSK